MSGVIDADGTQHERCNGCINWVNINDLMYEPPTDRFEYGRDLCKVCYLKAVVMGLELTPDPAALEAIAKAKADYDKSMEGKHLVFEQVDTNTWNVLTVNDTDQEVPA